MHYKIFGRSGLRVSEICLGAMTFGEDWGWGAAREESRRIFESFVERGGNFIDTANMYTNGTSEKFVGEFIATQREKFVVATKFSVSTSKGDPNGFGNHRKNCVQALEASLKRLKTDYIDLYWLHAWDFLTPVDEVMRTLDDLVAAGKVLYVGVSDTPAWIVSQANTLAYLRGWSRFAGLQIEYRLIERTPERELIPMARALGLAVTPWSPLGGGVLCGKYNEADGKRLEQQSKRHAINQNRVTEKNLKIAREVDKMAQEIGCKPAHVALNWLRAKSQTIPIVGARTLSQIEENLACLDHELSAEQAKRLDEVSRIELGFPHDFLASEKISTLISGGTFERIRQDN